MRIKTLIMILATLGFSASAFADHHMGHDGESKPFSIYGDFATSMQFHDNEGNNAAGNHDDFNVDLIEINLEKNWSMSKLHLSIGYGSTAGAVNTLGTLSVNTLNVMNAYYHMHTSYGLGFTVGKFESPVGHETYNHMDNPQFTRSYGFALAPYFSTGMMLDYGSDMWKVGLIASNGSGADTDGTDKNKTLGLVVDINPMDNLSVDVNYATGTEGLGATDYQIALIDFSVAYMVNEMFDVALNYADLSQKANTTGAEAAKANSIAAYVNANFGMFGLGLRFEQFAYDGSGNTNGGYLLTNGLGSPATSLVGAGNTITSTGEDNSIQSITLAAKAEIDQNALVMLEFRQDSSDDVIWADKAVPATGTDSFSTITAALMYRF